VKKGEVLGLYVTEVVGIPFCKFTAEPVFTDDLGQVETIHGEEIESRTYIKTRSFTTLRDLKGDLRYEYTILPRIVPKDYRSSPYFDLQAEPGGADGAGLTFLVTPGAEEEEKWDVSLSWDLPKMPEGAKGIWSYGSGEKKKLNLNEIKFSFYAVGMLNAEEEGEFGFYWFGSPPFDIKEAVQRLRQLFAYMSTFFKDTRAEFKIIARRNSFDGTGGTALPRSFLFGYSEKNSLTVDGIVNLLAHEMVHTWPHIEDEPMGIATWYNEGCAEYYSIMLPYRAGVFTRDELKAQIASRGYSYYSNPTGNRSNADLAKTYWKDRRTQRAPYGRGVFYIANTDAKIRRTSGGKHSVDDVVLEILEMARNEKKPAVEDWVKIVSRFTGEDESGDYEKMVSGTLIVPYPQAFDGAFAQGLSTLQDGKTEAGEIEAFFRQQKRAGRRALTIEDLAKVEYLSEPALSPNGEEAAYVEYIADEKSGDFIPHIYTIPLSGGERKLLLEPTALGPVYSPDGTSIACLSGDKGYRQILLVKGETGEMRRLTSLRHGVDSFAWSPDGKSIAFSAPVYPGDGGKEFTLMDEAERKNWEEEKSEEPIVVEKLMYKFDDISGIEDGRITWIGVVEIGSGSSWFVTKDAVSYSCPSWSMDSGNLAFVGKPYTDAKAARGAVFIAAADGSHSEKLSGPEDHVIGETPPLFSPDGKHVLYSGYTGLDRSNPFGGLLAVETKGGSPKPYFGEKTSGLTPGSTSIGITAYGRPGSSLAFSDDGVLWMLSSEDGNDGLYRIDKTGTAELISPWCGCVHSFAAPRKGKVIYIRGESLMIAELFCLDLASGKEKRLTYSNEWIADVELGLPEERRYAVNGANIHGFVMKGGGAKPGKKYPAVLDIRGGPEKSYGRDFWFELQYFAARGFAVVWCDPRGSAGYGEEFQKAGGDWDKTPMEDLLGFLDAAIGEGFIDPERLGVTGGSFGGNMTNRMIGKTKRFKAAATQRTLCNLATSYGTGDMGFVQGSKNFTTMLRMFQERVSRPSSTITQIDAINTPLLILHGTNDYRCSFEQGEQLFIAMKDRRPDVPVRFVAFPGANHGITRDGKIYFQQAHLKEMGDWFARHVTGGEEKNA
jgi:dipeptidyl aminopeptidase/acylaminoacyl peptidase